ncbi:MAG TPA: hypothetical protein DCP32_11260 [Anaerolineaceae bacterium]|nr:MAG: hypothetical protein A2X24_02995 [Chloroflexi bacterium GWB2_54_36]HAL17291.1 hypothetical protein [Anaerolineaceae bacterium]HBA92624.1 hypothetical protein [Anaerolineaceae bacterium]
MAAGQFFLIRREKIFITPFAKSEAGSEFASSQNSGKNLYRVVEFRSNIFYNNSENLLYLSTLGLENY